MNEAALIYIEGDAFSHPAFLVVWSLCRPQLYNRSGTSCHYKADNSHQDKCLGGGGSGGDLILSGDPDPWNPSKVTSYVQLFELDDYNNNQDLSFHMGALSATELRMIAEWLDAGGHYYKGRGLITERRTLDFPFFETIPPLPVVVIYKFEPPPVCRNL